MLFSDDFVASVKSDPVNGVVSICKMALTSVGKGTAWVESDFAALSEAFALLSSMMNTGLITYETELPELQGSVSEDCSSINTFIRDLQKTYSEHSRKLQIDSLIARFTNSLADGFIYEFSQGDIEAVQARLNELRAAITGLKGLEKDHRERLLRRLEKLQSELHKRVSDLDKFWGLIGDAGVVFGKLGKDAKPVVDRIKEIADIVWRTQARAEELPSGTELPRLENMGGKADAEA